MRLFEYKCALIALACFGRGLRAQHVSGHAREAGTGQPVPGAVVSLVDSAGHTTARTVSDVNGVFRLVGDGRTAAVHAIRIGFQPATTPIARTEADSTVTADVAMTILPATLEAVEVHDQSRCPANASAPAAFALWEQARAALLATVVAREADPANVRVLLYTRDTDPTGTKPPVDAVAESVFTASRAFISARATADYDTRGYRDLVGGGGQVFYAPDADVLLDSTFIRGHCLSLHDDAAGHTGDAGVAFVPAPGTDSLVDISGVIWLSRGTPELRSLDFRFTNLDSAAMGQQAGGELVFAAMPNGRVIEQRWNLHLPVVSRRPFSLRGGRIVSFVTGIHDVGGETTDASWFDGTTWHDQVGAIHGHVVEERTGNPIAGALVTVRGGRIQTRTNATGEFVFPSLIPGRYTVDATDGIFASFGVSSAATVSVNVDRSSASEVRFVVPARAGKATQICDEARRTNPAVPAGNSLLLGRAVLADGQPATDAVIRVRWGAASSAPDKMPTYSGRADSTGTFELCGIPRDVPVLLSAVRDSLVSVDTTIAFDSTKSLAEVTVRLVRPNNATLPAFRRRQISVLDGLSGGPLPGAEIVDPVGDRVIGLTSAAGTASLTPLPQGPSLIHVRKLGYEQRAVFVQISPDDTLPVAVTLRTVTQLAAVQVTTAAVQSSRALKSGFADRAKTGIGRFYNSKDLADRPGALSTVLVGLGLQPLDKGDQSYLMSGHAGQRCYTTVFLDGFLYYAEGSGDPPDFSRMYSDDYAAAEYYASPGEVPAEFNMTVGGSTGGSGVGATVLGGCGVLLLWTRD